MTARPLLLALPVWVLSTPVSKAEPLEDPVAAVTQDVFQGPMSFFADPARLSRDLDPFHAAGAPLDSGLPGLSLFAAHRGPSALVGGVAVSGRGLTSDSETDSGSDDLNIRGDQDEVDRWTDVRFGVGASKTVIRGVAAGIGLYGRYGLGSATLTGAPDSPQLGPNTSTRVTLYGSDGQRESITRRTESGRVRAEESELVLSGGLAALAGDWRPWGGGQLGVGRSYETIDYALTTTTQSGADDVTSQTEEVTGLSRSNFFGMENTQVGWAELRGGLDLGGTLGDPDWRITISLREGLIRPVEEGWTHEVRGDQLETQTTTYEITSGGGRLGAVEVLALGQFGEAATGRVRYGVGVSYARNALQVAAELTTPTEASSKARPKSLTGYDQLTGTLVSERELRYWSSRLKVSVPVAAELPLHDTLTLRAAVVASYIRQGAGTAWEATTDETDSAELRDHTSSMLLTTGLGISWVSPGGAGLHLAWQPRFGTTGTDLSTVGAFIAWHPDREAALAR